MWNTTTTIDNHISNGYIEVDFSLMGKGFPAFEAFIEDSKGQKIFMTNYVSPGKSAIVVRLTGAETQYFSGGEMRIASDNRGDFLVYFQLMLKRY